MTEKVIDLAQARADRQLAIDDSLRTEADEDVLCRITIFRSSRVNVWLASVFETDEQQTWLKRRLGEGITTVQELLDTPPEPPGPSAA